MTITAESTPAAIYQECDSYDALCQHKHLPNVTKLINCIYGWKAKHKSTAHDLDVAFEQHRVLYTNRRGRRPRLSPSSLPVPAPPLPLSSEEEKKHQLPPPSLPSSSSLIDVRPSSLVPGLAAGYRIPPRIQRSQRTSFHGHLSQRVLIRLKEDELWAVPTTWTFSPQFRCHVLPDLTLREVFAVVEDAFDHVEFDDILLAGLAAFIPKRCAPDPPEAEAGPRFVPFYKEQRRPYVVRMFYEGTVDVQHASEMYYSDDDDESDEEEEEKEEEEEEKRGQITPLAFQRLGGLQSDLSVIAVLGDGNCLLRAVSRATDNIDLDMDRLRTEMRKKLESLTDTQWKEMVPSRWEDVDGHQQPLTRARYIEKFLAVRSPPAHLPTSAFYLWQRIHKDNSVVSVYILVVTDTGVETVEVIEAEKEEAVIILLRTWSDEEKVGHYEAVGADKGERTMFSSRERVVKRVLGLFNEDSAALTAQHRREMARKAKTEEAMEVFVPSVATHDLFSRKRKA